MKEVLVLCVVFVAMSGIVQEAQGKKYCQTALMDIVFNTCRVKWFNNRKRSIPDGELNGDIDLSPEIARAFLVSHSRVKRGWASVSPGLLEECCHEGCSTEEVEEHC